MIILCCSLWRQCEVRHRDLLTRGIPTVHMRHLYEVLYNCLAVRCAMSSECWRGHVANGFCFPQDMCVVLQCKAYEGTTSPVEAHTSSLTRSFQGEVNENVYLGWWTLHETERGGENFPWKARRLSGIEFFSQSCTKSFYVFLLPSSLWCKKDKKKSMVWVR
jgi:hypothetical protein